MRDYMGIRWIIKERLKAAEEILKLIQNDTNPAYLKKLVDKYFNKEGDK